MFIFSPLISSDKNITMLIGIKTGTYDSLKLSISPTTLSNFHIFCIPLASQNQQRQ